MAKVALVSFPPCFLTSSKSDVKQGTILRPPPSASSCSSIASRLLPPIVRRPLRYSLSTVSANRGARSALYDDCENYVIIEPGQDELFVDLEELKVRLRKWLENWPNDVLPEDLARFEDLDDAVTYLVESACELDICDGSGTVQWFEVRL